MSAAPTALPDPTQKDLPAAHLRLVQGTQTIVPRSVERYTLYDEIAFGGMAAVHLGALEGAAGFRRPVAIKRLHTRLGRLPTANELRQEAWLGSQVRHPNVVAVLDLVQSGDKLLLVMEFVLGETLAGLIRQSGMMPVKTAVAILTDVLHGLHAAHTATGVSGRPLGIVHRDVSPQNILVGVDGVARILDFGVAKCLAAESTLAEPTEVGHVKGKLGYIAPEQLLSEPLDARTDVFAAGTVLWETLTGQRLFKSRDPMDAILHLVDEGIPPPSTFNGHIPPGLDQVVARALQRNPRLRFQSAEEFAEELEAVVRRSRRGHVGRYVEKAAPRSIDKQRYLLRCIQAPGRVKLPAAEVSHQRLVHDATPSSMPTARLAGSHVKTPQRRAPQASTARRVVLVSAGVLLSTIVFFSSYALLALLLRHSASTVRAAQPEAAIAVPQAPPAASAPAAAAVSEPAPRSEPAPAVVQSPPLVSEPSPGSEAAAETSNATKAPAAASSSKKKGVVRRSVKRTPAVTKSPSKRRVQPVPSLVESCNPPFSYDLHGIKRIKRRCL